MMLPARDISKMLPICSSLQKSPVYYFKILTLSESESFRKDLIFKGSRDDFSSKCIKICRAQNQTVSDHLKNCQYCSDKMNKLLNKDKEAHVYAFNFDRKVNIISERLVIFDQRCHYLCNDVLRYSDVKFIYPIREAC